MLDYTTRRHRQTRQLFALCSVLVLSACAAKYTQVPPRVNLARYGRIALVTFSSDRSNAAMSTAATRRFAEELLASQSGVELLEITASDSVVRSLGRNGDVTALAQALGRDRDVPAVFVGQLGVGGTRPHGRVSTASVSVRSSVSAELTVQLVSTGTGGTLWRGSATSSRTINRVGLSSDGPSVSLRNRDETYAAVVGDLVADVTRDFRATFVKQ